MIPRVMGESLHEPLVLLLIVLPSHRDLSAEHFVYNPLALFPHQLPPEPLPQ
jgi:hypothetical protein